MYDYRGVDGTGTRANPASGSNAVSYTIRKLADGNCWMSENLKLTLSTSHSYEVATFSSGTTSWTPNQDTSSSNPYNVAISQNTKANVNGGNWYYPWYAATAGQGTNTANPTINRSICPKGWKLPDNSSNPSFYNLITTAYKISAGTDTAKVATIKATPLSFISVGHSGDNKIYHSPSNGYFWSATPNTSDDGKAYSLVFSSISGYLGPQDAGNGVKFYGYPVRCVAIP